MSGLIGASSQGQATRRRGELTVGVVNHYERIDKLVDDIPRGVLVTEGA
jgi:hypothetical protein